MTTRLLHRIPPAGIFLLKAIGLYLLWFILYDLWLHPTGKVDLWVINNIIFFSSIILDALGYAVIEGIPYQEDFRTVGIDGTHGLWVGDACNGLELFALFTGFVLAYPGPWKRKLWFIPLGLVVIHFLNVIRVVALSLIDYHAPEYLEFNHTYTFTIFVYGCVFLLWMLWAGPLSGKHFGKTKE